MLARGSHNIILFNWFNKFGITLIQYPLYNKTIFFHKDYNVWCEWDNNGYKNIYNYGPRAYSVLVVDEPRILKPGEVIAVGCQVVPGLYQFENK
jgi:hypothetical protein